MQHKKMSKFIPNLSQLQDAIDHLPDPEVFEDSSHVCFISVDEVKKPVLFKKYRVNRGNKQPYRWIYEGKVLIRKRDAQEH